MKKLKSFLKGQGIKHRKFKRLYAIYKACERELKKAILTRKKSKEILEKLYKAKASKDKLKKARCRFKMAKNTVRMWKKMKKITLKYMENWIDIYKDCEKNKKTPKQKVAKTRTAKVVKIKAAEKIKPKPDSKKAAPVKKKP